MGIGKIRKWIRKWKNGGKSSSQLWVENLRSKGIAIGEDVQIYSPETTIIDLTAPWLVTIGDHVSIAAGVKILTHDYAWSVLKQSGKQPGSILGAQSPVTIGNGVYIGMDAIITRGVTVGDHVIIGAGSVVTKDCESGFVYAGNPARKIASLEEYYHKRADLQLAEAKVLAQRYFDRFGKYPPKEIFKEYFLLFSDYETAASVPEFLAQMKLTGNLEQTKAYMEANPARFESYEAFLQACFPEKSTEE